MADLQKKLHNKRLRKNRVRARVSGTVERPRLTVTVSNKHISAQLRPAAHWLLQQQSVQKQAAQ